MLEMAGCILRKAKRRDMVGVLKLSEEHGWNKDLKDFQHQFDLFPDGVFVAENTEGEIISHCASLPLDDANGFMALYITKKSWRRQGIGRKLFEMSYNALGNRNVGLNSVCHYQDMYASFGFRISTIWLQPLDCQINNLKIDFSDNDKGTIHLSPIREIGMDRIIAYDSKMHTMQRGHILRWYLDSDRMGLAAVDEGGKLVGWGLLTKSFRSYCLMPLYADTFHIAKTLLGGLLQKIKDEKDSVVQVVYPVENTAALSVFEEMGFSAGQRLLRRRMFTECDVPFEAKFVFSVLNMDSSII